MSASADKVWEVVRVFNGLPDYLPPIASSEIVSGGEGQVGSIRRLTTGDGAIFDERMTALDDADRTYTYEFVGDNPFGCRRYVSTIRVASITDTRESFIEWWSEFDAEGADEESLVQLFSQGVYAAGIDGLRKKIA